MQVSYSPKDSQLNDFEISKPIGTRLSRKIKIASSSVIKEKLFKEKQKRKKAETRLYSLLIKHEQLQQKVIS